MITPPEGPEAGLHPVNYEALKASMLYRAAAPLLPGEKTSPADKLSINMQEIKNFFYRFRIKNLTYEALMSFPVSVLSPAEKAFITFLQRNPAIFKRLSFLDHRPDSLSMQDVVLAARLAGDALILSERDLEYLREAPRQTLALDPDEPREAEHFSSDQIISVLNKLNPEGVHYRELHSLTPEMADLNGQEARILAFLQAPALQKMLYNLSLPYGGLLLPEVIRVLISLIWNPMVYGAVPIVFLKEPESEDEEEVEPTTRSQEIDDQDDDGQASERPLRRRVKLHAHDLLDILHAMVPKDGHVSLEQLRLFKPQSGAQAATLQRLRHAAIFKALATLDGDGQTLSEQDVKLALKEGVLLISDPYLTLAILL